MTRLIYLLSVLAVVSLSCGTSSPLPTLPQVQPAPLTSATPKNTVTVAPEKPANKAKMQAGYTSIVTADLLNIRTAPMGEIIPHVWLIEGEQVTVIECLGVWGRIGTGRWVNTVYLDKGCE